jgi:D-glycero-beta-D-manno-heptose 1-phosphate adenylyltransferase
MISDKVVPLEELQQRAKALRAAGKKIVATNGCFDLLHVGHVRYLNTARALGDALIVGINGDQSVRELKGAGRPVNNQNDRAEIIAALGCVDLVAIFPELRATRFLELAAPDIYVKGGDYNADTLNSDEREVLRKIGAKIDIVPLEHGFSTSDLVKRLSKLGK